MKFKSLLLSLVLFIFFTLVSCTKDTSTSPQPEDKNEIPSPEGWTLYWNDEFDIDGLPDPEKWNYEMGFIRNNEAQYYTDRDKNARVKDGYLILEAHREKYQNASYTSASIHTRNTLTLTYGRIEIKAKLTTGRGMWPALWTLGTNIGRVGWPDCGEIDIMENVGYDPLTIHGNVHTGAYNHVDGTARGQSIKVDDPSENFHIYAVEWFVDRIDFYVDETKYMTFENEHKTSAEWPYNLPQYLIMNVAVGGGWGGAQGIDESIFPQKMMIDYVRIYKYL